MPLTFAATGDEGAATVELQLVPDTGIGATGRPAPSLHLSGLPGVLALNPPDRDDPERDLAGDSFARMLVLYPEAVEDEATLEAIDGFVDRYGVSVAATEFGVMRWVPGAARFIRDEMELFEARGMNHAIWLWECSW